MANCSISWFDVLVRLFALANDPALGLKLLMLGIVRPYPSAAVLSLPESPVSFEHWLSSLTKRRHRTPDGWAVATLRCREAGEVFTVPYGVLAGSTDGSAGIVYAGAEPRFEAVDASLLGASFRLTGPCIVYWWSNQQKACIRHAVLVRPDPFSEALEQAKQRRKIFERKTGIKLTEQQRELMQALHRAKRRDG